MTSCKKCEAEFVWWEKNCPVCGTSTGGFSFLKNRAMLSWLRVVYVGWSACVSPMALGSYGMFLVSISGGKSHGSLVAPLALPSRFSNVGAQ